MNRETDNEGAEGAGTSVAHCNPGVESTIHVPAPAVSFQKCPLGRAVPR